MIIWDIADHYSYMDEELVEILTQAIPPLFSSKIKNADFRQRHYLSVIGYHCFISSVRLILAVSLMVCRAINEIMAFTAL